jgi:TolB-like protein/DNA-binding winged helix-turn-helix (wHTH) protein/Tfp pilus assembly protein PilF
VAPQLYEFGPYRLDAGEKLLLCRGEAVAVTPKGIEVLLVLVERAGQIVTKEELLRRVWPDTFVDEGNLTQTIFLLRKALGNGPNTQYIHTVPRRGYRFTAPVSCPQLGPECRQPNPGPRLPRRNMLIAAVLCACLLLAFWGLRSVVRQQPPIRTIAVLPLDNLSRDASDDYLADGITDALTTDLAQISSLRVIARSSAEQYKGLHQPLPQIAGKLHADAVVEGTVLRDGNQVRITAQLVRVSNEQSIWASAYVRELPDVIALENDIARQVAASIGARLSAGDRARFSQARLLDPLVHEAYLRGRYFWNRRTEPGYLEAIAQFQAAIDRDPSYAPAYSGLADSYALLGSSGTTAIARSEAMERARSAALKALQLDPNEAEAHASLGFVLMHYDWNFAAAEKEFQRAIELNPSYATAHQWHAYNLAASGSLPGALAEMALAHRMDPLSLIVENDEGELLIYARQFDKAIEHFQAVLNMDPDFLLANLFMSDAYSYQGKAALALEYAQRAIRLDSNSRWAQATLAATLADSGERARAMAIYTRLQRLPQADSGSGMLAAVAIKLGHKEQAHYWLEEAYKSRVGSLMLIRVDPRWDAVRGEPWFEDLTLAPALAASR